MTASFIEKVNVLATLKDKVLLWQNLRNCNLFF